LRPTHRLQPVSPVDPISESWNIKGSLMPPRLPSKALLLPPPCGLRASLIPSRQSAPDRPSSSGGPWTGLSEREGGSLARHLSFFTNSATANLFQTLAPRDVRKEGIVARSSLGFLGIGHRPPSAGSKPVDGAHPTNDHVTFTMRHRPSGRLVVCLAVASPAIVSFIEFDTPRIAPVKRDQVFSGGAGMADSKFESCRNFAPSSICLRVAVCHEPRDYEEKRR
jgi:hypothetical protein